jgi:GlpG protein
VQAEFQARRLTVQASFSYTLLADRSAGKAQIEDFAFPAELRFYQAYFVASVSVMRLIGHVTDEAAARIFGDYLYVQGIENQVDHETEGWAIWIADEDKIEHATSLLTEFRAQPADPKYKTEAKDAVDLRAREQKDRKEYRSKVRNRRHLFRPVTAYGFGALTFVLIVICITIFVITRYGNDHQRMLPLFISELSASADGNLPEIRKGEVWRLVTPIFIHLNVMHILFNMLWLRDLGSMIEGRQTSLHLAILVVAIAVGSNAAQFYVEKAHNFGGMSGVVYGLLGYIWLRGKFDPGSGLYLHSSTVTMMLIWFFICLVGILPFNIANTAHAVGLLMGMAWGYLSSLRYR